MVDIEHLFNLAASLIEEEPASKASIVPLSEGGANPSTSVDADSAEAYAEENFVETLEEVRQLKTELEALSKEISDLDAKLKNYTDPKLITFTRLSESEITELRAKLASLESRSIELHFLLSVLETELIGAQDKVALGEVLMRYNNRGTIDTARSLLNSYERHYADVKDAVSDGSRREI